MAKPRYRLMRLRDAPDGARFVFQRTFSQATLITRSLRVSEAIFHFGFEFNLKAVRRRTWLNRQVWVRVCD